MSQITVFYQHQQFMYSPLTLKKLSEHSVATALAKRVLPTPGGPYLKKKIIILKFQARKILKWIQYTTILNLSLITVDLKKSEKKTANLQLARFFGKELKLNSKYTKPYSLET